MIAVVVVGLALWVFVVYRTCDDCHEFRWSTRYRRGQFTGGAWVRNFSGGEARLCDECLRRRP